MQALPHSEPERAWRGAVVLLVAVVAVQVVPLWTLRFFPTQDGPSHQALSALERQFDGPDSAIFHEYFTRNPRPVPNAVVPFLMDRVLGAVPVATAERLVLTLYVILLPACAWYALRALDPRAGPLAIMVLPFTFSVPMQTGFFNFCLSLAAYFAAIGYWWKHRDRTDAWHAGGFAVLALWVYFCHVISFAMLAMSVLTVGAWRTALDGRRRVVWLARSAAALTPPLALFFWFSSEHPPGKVVFLSTWNKLGDLVSLRALEVMHMTTHELSIATAGLFALAIVVRLALQLRAPAVRGSAAWLAVALVFLAAYLVVPNEFGGGGYDVVRFALYPFLAAILWLGAAGVSRRFQILVGSTAAALALGLLGLYWQAWRHLDGYLAEYVSVSDHIEPGRTVLALSYNRMGPAPDGGMLAYRSDPFLHASGYIAAQKPIVDLNLYEATSTVFSMEYRPEKNPFAIFPELEAQSPTADVLSYAAKTGGRIDYVILWRASPDDPRARAVMEQLDAAYERTFVSARGLARLYRRR